MIGSCLVFRISKYKLIVLKNHQAAFSGGRKQWSQRKTQDSRNEQTDQLQPII